MKTKSLLFCFLCLIASSVSITVKSQGVNVTDSLALVDLYNSTNGPNWVNHKNWLTTKPVKTWFGITVTGTRVTSIYFYQNNLDGFLPPSIGNISALRRLIITGNPLAGSIPASIGNLTALTEISFNSNQLTGGIPSSIGNLVNLTFINLSANPLGGSIPSSVGNLVKVTEFYMNSDNLTDTVPASVGNLIHTTYLEFNNNQLTGNLPPSLGNLVNLTGLYFGRNQLTGSLPVSLGNLANVIQIDLSFNQLSGSIPEALFNAGNLPGLEELDLNDNQLTGSIPSTIGNLPRMAYLLLFNNGLSGSIPSSIGNLPFLHGLYLSNNHLSGSLPASMGNLPGLNELVADHNELSGSIPASFRSIPELDKLIISHNHFSLATNVNFPLLYKPDFTGDISYNNFTFNGLESVARRLPATTYTPQLPIAIHQHNGTLAVSAGGTLSNNTYKWFRAGSTDSTVITGDSTFQPTQGGQYYAKVTNAVARKLTIISDTVNYAASLTKTETVNKISVYPNPVKGVLTINGLDAKSTSNITVADISGHVWLNTITRQQLAAKLDVTHLKPGNYVLQVSHENSISKITFMKK